MESLASAADRQRAKVAEIFQATGLGNGPIPGTTNTTNDYEDRKIGAEDLLEEVQKDIAMVADEARDSSKKTAETFDEIKEIVNLERERALNEIDQRLWKQLDPLEAKKQRLDSLLNRQATVTFPKLLHFFLLPSFSFSPLYYTLGYLLGALSRCWSRDRWSAEPTGFRQPSFI